MSSRKMPPSSSVVAGTMHRPSDSLQPQGYSLDVPMLIICTCPSLIPPQLRCSVRWVNTMCECCQGREEYPQGTHMSQVQLFLHLALS